MPGTHGCGLINVNAKQAVKRQRGGTALHYKARKAVYNYHKCLKAMLNRAKDCGIIDISPYDRLKGRFKKGEDDNMEYLTEGADENDCDRSPCTWDAAGGGKRDLFVFQMFTGMAFADAQEFDISQYREVASGSRDTIAGQLTKEGDGEGSAIASRGNGTKEGDKSSESRRKQWVYVGERKKTGVQYVSVLLPPVVDVLRGMDGGCRR